MRLGSKLLRHVNKLVRDLPVGDELLNDPLEALSALDHVNNEHALVISVLLENVLLELDVAATDADHERIVVRVLLDVQSLRSNQVKVIFDQNNWELDLELLNVEFDLLIDLVTLSWLESHWRVREQVVALLVQLGFGNAQLAEFIENWLLELISKINCILK